jgi:hypothetical protein
VVVTVNLGPTTLVSASITAATTTTTFTELLNISISGLSEEQRTRLATRPIKVAAYTGLQHLSTQRADVLLSALVSESIALGYRHVLFSYAPAAQQPPARSSASAFEHLMGTGLPDRETCADEVELSFDKALYNWLVYEGNITLSPTETTLEETTSSAAAASRWLAATSVGQWGL